MRYHIFFFGPSLLPQGVCFAEASLQHEALKELSFFASQQFTWRINNGFIILCVCLSSLNVWDKLKNPLL